MQKKRTYSRRPWAKEQKSEMFSPLIIAVKMKLGSTARKNPCNVDWRFCQSIASKFLNKLRAFDLSSSDRFSISSFRKLSSSIKPEIDLLMRITPSRSDIFARYIFAINTEDVNKKIRPAKRDGFFKMLHASCCVTLHLNHHREHHRAAFCIELFLLITNLVLHIPDQIPDCRTFNASGLTGEHFSDPFYKRLF